MASTRNTRIAGRVGLGIAAVGLLSAGLLGYQALAGNPDPSRYRTVQAGPAQITQTLSISGTVHHVNDVSVSFPTTGLVTTVNVKPGDHVTVGQPLASIDSQPLKNAVLDAEAAYLQAVAKLDTDTTTYNASTATTSAAASKAASSAAGGAGAAGAAGSSAKAGASSGASSASSNRPSTASSVRSSTATGASSAQSSASHPISSSSSGSSSASGQPSSGTSVPSGAIDLQAVARANQALAALQASVAAIEQSVPVVATECAKAIPSIPVAQATVTVTQTVTVTAEPSSASSASSSKASSASSASKASSAASSATTSASSRSNLPVNTECTSALETLTKAAVALPDQMEAAQKALTAAQASLNAQAAALQKQAAELQAQAAALQQQGSGSAASAAQSAAANAAQQAAAAAGQSAALGAAGAAAQQSAAAAAAKAGAAGAGAGGAGGSVTEATLITDRSNVDQTRLALTQARDHLNQATIASPIDGVVASMPFTVGQSAGASASAVIIGAGVIEVTVPVPLAQRSHVVVGQPATVTSPIGGTNLKASITRIGLLPVASASTGTSGNAAAAGGFAGAAATTSSVSYPVVVTIPNGGDILPESSRVQATITTQVVDAKVAVPAAAVTPTGVNQATVTVLNGTTTQVRTVTTGASSGTDVEIVAGIQAGEHVVVADLEKPLPGISLRATQQASNQNQQGGFGGQGGAAPSGQGRPENLPTR